MPLLFLISKYQKGQTQLKRSFSIESDPFDSFDILLKQDCNLARLFRILNYIRPR